MSELNVNVQVKNQFVHDMYRNNRVFKSKLALFSKQMVSHSLIIPTQLVSCPFTQDPETVPEELQIELIDHQSDTVMKEKFSSVELDEFHALIRAAKFPNIQ